MTHLLNINIVVQSIFITDLEGSDKPEPVYNEFVKGFNLLLVLKFILPY